MDLISESYSSSSSVVINSAQVSNNIVVDAISNTNIYIPNIHTGHQQEYVCSDGSSSNLFDTSKSIDGTIYNMLSRQDEMKTLQYPNRVKSEFDLYIEYAELKTSNGIIPDWFNDFDIYLGSIGVERGNIC